jgi:hypothetical protein
MSGYPEFNYPAFMAAEEEIKSWHHFAKVWNPATHDAYLEELPAGYETGDFVAANKHRDFREVFGWDVQKVVEADAIYMLAGWQYSPGAVAEHAVAIAMKKHDPSYEIYYEECSVFDRQSSERENTEASPTLTGREPSYGGL